MLGEILKPSYDLFVTHFPHREWSEKKRESMYYFTLWPYSSKHWNCNFFSSIWNSDLISLNIRMLTLLFQTLELWFDPYKRWNSDLISSKHWNSDLIPSKTGILTLFFQPLELSPDPSKHWNSDLLSSQHWKYDLIFSKH